MSRTVRNAQYRKARREHGCINPVVVKALSIDEMFAAAAEARNA